MATIKKSPEKEIKLLRKRIAILEKLNAHYKEVDVKIVEAQIYAQNIVETIREPLLILDGALKVVSANKAFYRNFKVDKKETQGRFVYDLGNGQWDIPQLRKLLKEVITKKNTFNDYEIAHKFETIGEKTMLLNARRIPPTPAKPRIILLAIEDVTAYRKLQLENASDSRKQAQKRAAQLDALNKKLKEKISELEVFNKAAIGRELTMIELKKEIETLKKAS